jgi:hypothetical protein
LHLVKQNGSGPKTGGLTHDEINSQAELSKNLIEWDEA